MINRKSYSKHIKTVLCSTMRDLCKLPRQNIHASTKLCVCPIDSRNDERKQKTIAK